MAKSRGIREAYRVMGPDERARVAARVREDVGLARVASEFGVSVRTVQRARDAAVLLERRAAHSGFRLSPGGARADQSWDRGRGVGSGDCQGVGAFSFDGVQGDPGRGRSGALSGSAG